MFFKIHSYSTKKLPAFSIGEVLIASFVLVTGILSVVGLVSFSYRTSGDTQDLIIASELAQEGVELVRNIRDNEIAKKQETGVPADVLAIFPNNNTCRIDYDDAALDCTGTPDPALNPDNAGFYASSNGNAAYYRRIKVDHPAGQNWARAVSLVSWQDPGNNLNGNIAASIAWCTLANKCVYTELLLTPWK